MRLKSVKTLVMTPILGAGLAFGLALGSVFSAFQYGRIVSDFQDTSDQITAMLGNIMSITGVGSDLQRIVDNFNATGAVKKIIIFDKDKRIHTSSDRMLKDSAIDGFSFNNMSFGDIESALDPAARHLMLLNDGYFITVTPYKVLNSSSLNDGSVVLIFDIAQDRDRLVVVLAGLLTFLLIFSVVGSAIIYKLIHRAVIKPLVSLDDVLHKFGETRGRVVIPDDGKTYVSSELNAIRVAFNEMAASIESNSAEILEARDVALEASKTRARFLANMSHEIRTPLNGIIGMCELLGDTSLSHEQASFVVTMRQSGEHLLALVNDILDYSKIDASKIEIVPARFKLELFCRAVMMMVNHSVNRKNVSLNMSLSPDLPAEVFADEARLRQILLNLLSNAIKFTKEGHITLRVFLSVEGGLEFLSFQVEDTGAGIPEDKKARLFSPFEQGDGSTTKKYGGTGLGLVISKRLAELMGGDVTFTSEEGKGSVFTARVRCERVNAVESLGIGPKILPDSAATNIAVTEHSGSSDGVDFSKVRILLAEDNAVNQKVALSFLKKMGCQRVDVADDGQFAIEKSAGADYDVILMDLQMPRVDGLSAAKVILERSGVRRPHIIAVTANAFEEVKAQCLEVGISDFVSKPMSSQGLRQAIERVLKSRESGKTSA